MRLLKGAAALAAGAVVVAACSEDDSTTVRPDSGTAGKAGSGSGGSAGSSGSGGSGGSSGTGGAGGSGGSGGGSAGNGGSAGADASDDASDAADSGPLCPDVPGGDSGIADGAPDAMITRWRDWAAASCKPCPAPVITCGDLEGAATFDKSTRVLSIELAPGVAQLVTANLSSFRFQATAADGGSINGTAQPAAFTIDENTLTVDLSADVPEDVTFVESVVVALDDACGAHSADIGPLWSYPSPDPGASIINIYCE